MNLLDVFKPKESLATRTEQALLERLPVESKTLRRIGWLMEPKNLKHVAIAIGVGAITFSTLESINQARRVRCAVGKELKKQLEPVNKKLDALEAQNEELKRQNNELRKKLEQSS